MPLKFECIRTEICFERECKIHLLAVDDDPFILELLKELVKCLGGHTLRTANCAADALDFLTHQNGTIFDCFLLDIQMPGTDGIELCKILRSRPDHKATPILMLTAISEKCYIDRAFSAGASDYITKPFQIEELRGRIGLVESLIAQRKVETEHAYQLRNDVEINADSSDEGVKRPLHEPLAVQNVDGVIEHKALENYVTLLSREELFGSSVLAFCIRNIKDLYEKTSGFEYDCLITDVAEAIACNLEKIQFLSSYAGNGVFICILERGWQPDLPKMTDNVNLTLHNMGLYFNDGQPMQISISHGDMIRLIWKTGDKALDALATAYESAELESRRHARNLEDFWHDGVSA